EVTAVPEMPVLIAGIVNYHGRILPVLDLRKKLKLADKAVSADMHFLVVTTRTRQIIMIAEVVEGVIKVSPEKFTDGAEIEKDFTQASFIRLDDGIIFVYDVEQFLSDQDEAELENALNNFEESHREK
ncbi:MAG: chemotaxis protein CheW, partial [Bacteroidetes bacterium]|nr:chemotaxis protein CheW [Bacteroidota bacterium]